MQSIVDICAHLHKNQPLWQPPKLLLSLDPGETTGWSLFAGLDMLECGQLDTKDMQYAPKVLEKHLQDKQPSNLVVEDYRVYSWKAKDHSWEGLHTPRFIGCAETLCSQRDIPLVKQMAQVAKGFCTDEKLKAWGIWQSGQRHARDAIRHAIYYILFNHLKQIKGTNKLLGDIEEHGDREGTSRGK